VIRSPIRRAYGSSQGVADGGWGLDPAPRVGLETVRPPVFGKEMAMSRRSDPLVLLRIQAQKNRPPLRSPRR